MSLLESRWTTVDGLRMHAKVSPAGAADVVLLHGLGVGGAYLMPTAERLAPHFRVHVPDLPGFGSSDRPDHALSVPELADALVRWLDAAGLQGVHVVANSMGCQV